MRKKSPSAWRENVASVFSVQTNRNRHSLHLPEASETTGLDFFSAACVIKRTF